MAAIVSKGELVYDYVETYLYTSSFRNTHSHAVQPILTEDIPPDYVEEPQILVPDVKRSPERPRTKMKANLGSKKLPKAQK
ncbi:hypothetical protein FRX31_035455 [Thalictrum thalictroides]|uniref:Uncharacterized protein n=1 Tax=Thalictrum thalictroides TaxID=46969 RepID=A0A7J6UQY8_THATH|nr:hypothetical protein FRX31_035455 [Thalictrum thalictroides]